MNEELSRKQHTEEELQIITAAYNDLSKEYSNELREVLIKSEDVIIGKLIGKGGNGTVHMGVLIRGNQSQ